MYQTRSTPSPFLIRPETATQWAILVMRCMEHSSRNAPIGFNKVSDFVFLYCFLGSLWVLSIPKWLINDSGPIAILFIWILELSKIHKKKRPSLDLWTPYLLQTYFQKYDKMMGASFANVILSCPRTWKSENFGKLRYRFFWWGWGGGVLGTSFFVNFDEDGHKKIMKIG